MTDAAPSELVDRFGRRHTAMRVSVTDRCNLRCHYCMPVAGLGCAPKEALLSFEEITFAVGVAAQMGITRIRITGGEPLLRAELPTLIRMLREETAVEDIALTTNGLLLARQAQALAEAGLDRINVSIDSLDPERFHRITRFGTLEKVWAGIRAAGDAGLGPIKINALALDGFNDDEFEAWTKLTLEQPVIVRFMELMPIGEGAKMAEAMGTFLDLTAVRERLQREFGIAPDTCDGNGPARYWSAPGAPGKLGFITPMSNPYCDTCSRLRLTSQGGIRACLADDRQVEAGPAISARDVAGVRAAFEDAVRGKPRGHRWSTGEVTAIGMSQVGG